MATKKESRGVKRNKLINQAKREVPGFTELLDRFERTVSVLGRSQSTFDNYSRHVASISLCFGKVPTMLDSEQVHDYLFYLQKNQKLPRKPILSTAFMDFASCLNLKVCLTNTFVCPQ
jgi:hypothetical protein